ncbi:anthrax toxin lethal factor-related metalloendopeptidase [Rossellomorea sp. BNER]|uniref:anthrax toxin lethal factor-related metalloendopeptidase n=1 Tax=Rossellomorea sp. BNER TaxID=2962031 RepID=UPI003AF24BE2|nr:toxin [Rossellomorea sp. BNER]
MNKPRLLFVALTIIMFLWHHTEASYSGVLLKHSKLTSDLALRSPVLKEIVLLPTQTYDEDEVRAIVERLDHLPTNLLERVNSKEIKVRLFQEQLTDFPSTDHLKGVTPRGYTSKEKTWDQVPGIGGSRLVLVKIGHSDKGMGHGSENLELHELAHSIDRYVLNDLYLDMEFLNIWKRESTLLFPNQAYFTQYQEEYFAETFTMFYLNHETRKLLKEKAPATYQFFKEINSI